MKIVHSPQSTVHSPQRHNLTGITLLLLFCVLGHWVTGSLGHAEELTSKPSSGELVLKAWEVHGKKDVEATFKVTQECIDLYKEEAGRQQASLSALPTRKGEIEAVQVLNDVATCYFIQAESYRDQGKLAEAKKAFQLIVDQYSYAQAWDPRGWFWHLADAAKKSIDRIEHPEAAVESAAGPKVSQLKTKLALYDPGKEDVVDYKKYGEFKNAGTGDYQYIVKDQEGLSLATGEGIYPNTTSVRWDPNFRKALKEKRLEGSQWDFLQSPDVEAAFFKWTTSSEPQGVRLFYTALVLEKAGLIKHAIKAYYAVVVHFPGAYGWTYWHTPWYVGQAAIAKIHFLLRRYPQIGYKLVDANIRISNGYDNDVANDVVITNPGRFVKSNALVEVIKRSQQKKAKIKKTIGEGRIKLIQYQNGHWQMFVDGKPFTVKAVTYSPTKIGQSPDFGTLGNWMEEDFNKNGRMDGPYDAFVDKNGNNIQDANEPAVGDFRLMKEMGVNAIRLYHHPKKVNKELLRELYNNYGIMVIMGDFLGKYALGSGASWYEGTDYSNPEHKKKMIESVTEMVMEFKDEPFMLCWLLGNENVYGVACNANKDPETFFKFANEAAQTIKSMDKNHPVAICSGDTLFLEKFGKNAPDIDIFGTNAYRGDFGFGYLWQAVKEEADRPVFITEFGCPAYAEGRSSAEAEQAQADYHRGCWEDIEYNAAFGDAAGNSIGGIVFEWLDEWWKAYEPFLHDTKGLFSGPFPDGFMHEEWLGVCGQGKGKQSPFLRELRKGYYLYKEMWR